MFVFMIKLDEFGDELSIITFAMCFFNNKSKFSNRHFSHNCGGAQK